MDAQEQRRLLELAAKAIGWTILDWYGDRHTAHDGEKLVPWNPLADDGDALRLAVKLGMCVDICLSQETWALTGYNESINVTRHHCESDSYAATRLAIVRAAAAFGEKMEKER